LVVPFNKALVFLLVVANSGYFTVFTHHIYFIILISMIAGNFVEIRLPKIQSRKCLRKSNLWRYSSLQFASTQGIFSFHYIWNILFCFSLSFLLGVFSLCNLLLSVSRAALLTLKKQTGHFYVWTASLIRLSIIERITTSVKLKTDSILLQPSWVCVCVCAPLITGGSYRTTYSDFVKH
jgi:hypothetical protein